MTTVVGKLVTAVELVWVIDEDVGTWKILDTTGSNEEKGASGALSFPRPPLPLSPSLIPLLLLLGLPFPPPIPAPFPVLLLSPKPPPKPLSLFLLDSCFVRLCRRLNSLEGSVGAIVSFIPQSGPGYLPSLDAKMQEWSIRKHSLIWLWTVVMVRGMTYGSEKGSSPRKNITSQSCEEQRPERI